MDGRVRRRAAAWGVAAAIAYLVIAPLAWRDVPARLLYEGEAPPAPYRWVHPPPALTRDNQAPSGGSGQIGLNPTGSGSASILTDDAQAGVIFPHDAVAPQRGIASAMVRITPVDPDTVAPPPPGYAFDGNGYRVEASYPNGRPVVLRHPVTPVLRYPRHATVLLRWNGKWTFLDTKRVQAALQIFAASDQLGVFVAARPVGGGTSPWLYAAGAAGVLVIAAAAALALRRRRAIA